MSSSESEDENIKRCLEAADTTLINDAMFQNDPDMGIQIEQKRGHSTAKPIDCPKSNRYLIEEENVFQSDINVTESMKKFIGKKLSTIIEQKIDYVDLNNLIIPKSVGAYGVKLLRDCDSYLKIKDDEENPVLLPKNKKIKPISKRTVEPDDSKEKDKLKLAAIEPNAIVESTKCWTNRPKATLYEYKTIGSSNTIQEPLNEFTNLKRKNNWNASKIESFRKKTKQR